MTDGMNESINDNLTNAGRMREDLISEITRENLDVLFVDKITFDALKDDPYFIPVSRVWYW